MLELAALGLLAVGIVVALATGVFVLKTVVWLLLLPVRLIIGLVTIPLFLLKLVLGALFCLVTPFVGLVLLVGLLALAVTIIVPLLPFTLFAVLIASAGGAVG